jgi:hypothetical protein
VGKSNTWSTFGGKMGRPVLFGGNHQIGKKNFTSRLVDKLEFVTAY